MTTRPLLAAALLLLSADAGRADPAADALRLAPPDAAIVVVVRDLRTHLAAVTKSPFAEWLQASPLGKQLTDPAELDKLRALETFFAEQLGATAEQVRDDLLGDAVVFAFRPGPPGKPKDEAGVILVQARNPDLLAQVVNKLNQLQQKSGELRAVTERSHRGRAYFEREKADGKKEFYLLRGGLLAFSAREPELHGVIDRDLDPAKKPGPAAAGLAKLGLAEAFVSVWFNPRGFDAVLATQADAAKDATERAFLAQFRKVWAATDGLALFAQPGTGLELGLTASVDREKLPAELREVVFPPAGGSAAWAGVPADALLAVGGRVDVPKVLAAMRSFLPDAGRDQLDKAVADGLGPLVGKDKLSRFLAGVGPDWAAWVAPPAKAGDGWVPGWLAAVKVTDDREAVGRPLVQLLDFAVQMVRYNYNRTHRDQIELREEEKDGVAVKVLANDDGFPAGFRPAYAVAGGYLVVAGSPETVRAFAPAEPSADPPLLRVSGKRLSAYLHGHGPAVAKVLAKWGDRPAADVARELAGLAAVAEAFDRVEVRYTAKAGTVRLTVRAELVKPLK